MFLKQEIYKNYQTLSHQHLSSWINSNKIIKLDLTIPLTDMQENAHLNVTRLEHKDKTEELERANTKLLSSTEAVF